MSRVKNVFKGNAGFTLIELLIVIVIIGILAAIAIPNIVGLTDRADKSAAESDLRTFQTIITAYRADEGDFPDTITGAEATNDFTQELQDLWADLEDKYDSVDYTSATDNDFTVTLVLTDDTTLTLTSRGVSE